MKHCKTCQRQVNVSEFHQSGRSRDGLRENCKACNAEAKRSRLAARQEAIDRMLVERDGKRCPRCQTSKPWDDFHKLSAARDGRQVYCKPCGADIQRECAVRQKDARAMRAAEKLANAPTSGTKTCTKCGETKPVVSFYLHRGTRDGRTTYCGDCQSASSRAWTAANAERVRERNARHIREHPEMHRRTMRRWTLRLYGLTEEGYQALLESQDGVCAICLLPERYIDARTGLTRRLAVDHDHATGMVRGLLCGRCNRSIGQFADDHERLERAAAYLKRVAQTTV